MSNLASMRSLFVTSFLLIAAVVFAQKKPEVITDYIPTDNLDVTKDDNKKSNRPKDPRSYQLIYTADANSVLYGNQCALEETRKMGFEYIIELPYAYGRTKTGFGKFLNNLAVKSRLVVTRTPFWKAIVLNGISP